MKTIAITVLCFLIPWGLSGQTPRVINSEKADFILEEVVSGVNHPWSLSWLPDGTLIFTQRSGALSLYMDGRTTGVEGVPKVAPEGQGGLLEVVVDPQFTQNRWIYLSYAANRGNQTWLEVTRGKLTGNRLTELQVLWSQKPESTTRVHYGGRMAFLPDGSLVISTGDRGSGPRAQDPSDGAGKTIRILPEGKIPQDNPFLPTPGSSAFYSLGHRNIQGMAVHPQTGALWATEHGPRGGDELNLILPGKNYGWPVITHGVDYSGAKVGEGTAKVGLEQPVVWWTPSPAPSGLTWYTGRAFPQWQGHLFSGNLAGQHLLRMEVSGGKVVAQEKLLVGTVGRIRDVRTGPDGLLYLTTDSPRGKILRLKPTP